MNPNTQRRSLPAAQHTAGVVQRQGNGVLLRDHRLRVHSVEGWEKKKIGGKGKNACWRVVMSADAL